MVKLSIFYLKYKANSHSICMINDILGIHKLSVKNVLLLNERLNVTRPQKCLTASLGKGVLPLKSESLTSIPVQNPRIYNSSSALIKLKSQWVKCETKNSSDPFATHFCRWARLEDVVPRSQRLEGEKKEKQVDLKEKNDDATQRDITQQCESQATAPTKNSPVFLSEKFKSCAYVPKVNTSMFQLIKKNQAVSFSPRLYQKLFATNSDTSWTQWETEYLFNLCATFDLKFVIIYDRYIPLVIVEEAINFLNSDPCVSENKNLLDVDLLKKINFKTQKFLPCLLSLYKMSLDQVKVIHESIVKSSPRSIEHLKDRYYSIAWRIVEHDFNKTIQSIERRFTTLSSTVTSDNINVLLQQKTQILSATKAEMARHPLIRFPYDLVGDKQRRDFLEKQYQMSEEKRQEQQELIREIISREKTLKNNSKRDYLALWTNRKRKKSNVLLPIASSRTHEIDLPFPRIPNDSIWSREPGVILASQVMQQFAAPILLQSAATAARTSIPGGTISTCISDIHTNNSGTLEDSGSQNNNASNSTLSALKRHEERVENEFKTLGFGTAVLPLWPTHRSREIVETFNTLRVDIVTLINLNATIEQLEKEKQIWKTNVSQIKEEPKRTQSPTSNSLTNKTSTQQTKDLKQSQLASSNFHDMNNEETNYRRTQTKSSTTDTLNLTKKPRKSQTKKHNIPPKAPTTF